jgi:hypothetical protein
MLTNLEEFKKNKVIINLIPLNININIIAFNLNLISNYINQKILKNKEN